MDHLDKLFEKTKGNLFFNKKAGFLGVLLCNLKFRWDSSIPTAATDGLEVIWNPEFFLSLDPETRLTVLAHELWHVAYLHMVRRQNRDPQLYNIAADHVINLMLKEHGYYMDGFPYVMDRKYTGWSTEDIYDDLVKNPPKEPQAPMQDILEPGEGASSKAGEIIQKVVGAVTTAKITNSAGSIPGEVTRTLDAFLNPKLPWEVLLMQFFNDLSEPEYSLARPNRRYQDPVLPGLVKTSGLEHLIYYLDISGSVSDHDILRFNSEVKYIKDQLEPEKLTLVTFDTKIRDEYVFEKDDPFEKIVVTGRGGTDLDEVMDHANRHDPSAMVIFSDLYVDIPHTPPKCPLLWVQVGSGNKTVPYGKLIQLDD